MSICPTPLILLDYERNFCPALIKILSTSHYFVQHPWFYWILYPLFSHIFMLLSQYFEQYNEILTAHFEHKPSKIRGSGQNFDWLSILSRFGSFSSIFMSNSVQSRNSIRIWWEITLFQNRLTTRFPYAMIKITSGRLQFLKYTHGYSFNEGAP